MKPSSTLKGICWNHSRAFPPLVAAAQRFGELNPGTTVTWEKRSLHKFGHANLADLCARYDLIVVDHPMLGEAHEQDLLVDLKPKLNVDSPFAEYLSISEGTKVRPIFESIVGEPLPVSGCVTLTDKPGFGVELNHDFLSPVQLIVIEPAGGASIKPRAQQVSNRRHLPDRSQKYL